MEARLILGEMLIYLNKFPNRWERNKCTYVETKHQMTKCILALRSYVFYFCYNFYMGFSNVLISLDTKISLHNAKLDF